MFNYFRKELDWGGRKLVLETGKMARQADGAVLARYGDTIVLCTAVGVKSSKPGQDFFPLTVNYQEKAFAAGKIPGGFFKREGRPSEKEVLVSRLIDRPIRPLFPEGFRNEVQVVATVLSHDLENDPDIVAMVGCSAALTLSGIPFFGPVAAARVGYQDGAVHPEPDRRAARAQHARPGGRRHVRGRADGGERGARAARGGDAGRGDLRAPAFQPVITRDHRAGGACRQGALAAVRAGRGRTRRWRPGWANWPAPALAEAYHEKDKQVRHEKVDAAKAAALATLAAEGRDAEKAKRLFKDLEADIVRNAILDTGLRIDGRDTRTVRPIIAEVGILPRAHGSALFTRGETQALCVATLGTGQDEQVIDALEGEYREHFMLHYNFPPYSVGEAGRMGSPGRREVGHGKLAWRAVHPLLPAKDKFPYTLRVVSEITESNGSSSMATVCGSSLALMDAGVPLTRPVAGIAMGLIKEDRGFAVLSDILGDEDHLGDMDFKVAGTEKGVTSLQMDIKITSITPEIMRIALDQAREGRMHILGEMAKAITGARSDVAATAPRITMINVPKEKIREVIGTGGKVIREIVEQTGMQDRHRGRRHDQDRGDRRSAGAGGDRLDPRDRRGAGDRRDLQRQGGEDRRFRGVRELPGVARRAGAHQRAAAGPGRQDHRRGQCRRPGEGEGHRLRRARQGEAVDAGGRSGDRGGHHREGRGQAGPGRPRPAGSWRPAARRERRSSRPRPGE